MANQNNGNGSRQRSNNGQNRFKSASNGNRQQGSGGEAQWRSRFEHYSNLARQADDRVERELYWQHAEHYCRLINGTANL